MLEAAGFRFVSIEAGREGWGFNSDQIGVAASCHQNWGGMYDDVVGNDSGVQWKQHAFAPTREEAAARLWVAVTKR
jgi:hypothetical protein